MEAQEFSHPIHRISVAQFHRMIASGVFQDDDRVELIDGEMRDMAPIGPPHNGCTAALTRLFVRALGDEALVIAQGPLALDDGTELYPDLLVVKPRDDLYQTSNPTADEVLLLIEVSDSTLSFDLNTKLPMYARAGVGVCWIVDVRHKAIREYREPDRFGRRYQVHQTVTAGVLRASLAGMTVEVATADLFRF